jgi:hypothetical protein
MKLNRCISILFAMVFGGLLASVAAQPAVAQIQVNSANPSAAPQGTINLNVLVTGNGFKKGAKAQWFVTGTTNPGGVTVNSTTFNGSTQITANITVASDAAISGFDIVVTNLDGRTGKGTDKFAVIQGSNNANSCTVQPLPSGISWVASLNYVAASGAAAFGANFGVTTRSRQMLLGGVNVLVVGVGTPATTGNLEIFVLNPSTGLVLDGTRIGSNTAIQPHITVNLGAGTSGLAVGDVNGDGIPDFLAGSKETNAANAVVGSVDANGILSYGVYPLTIPANVGGAGWSGAMGDLQGTGNDVMALGAIGGGTTPGQVLLYEWNGSGFTNYLNIVSPLQNQKGGEEFGHGMAIADVTGGTAQDLIVGAPGSIVGGQSGAGRVLIFPGPVSATNYVSLTTGVKNDALGTYVTAGDIDGDTSADGYMDVLATSAARALGYYGPISGGQSSSSIVQPQSKLSSGWSTTQPAVGDINGDGFADVLIGAPNATSQPICGGAAYLWLSSGTPLATEIVLSTPVANAGLYGWATGFGPGTRLFFVTDHYMNIGTTSEAGQVYVYKVD